MTYQNNERRENNSSCGLFLAIIFVLMLFGNHGPQDPDAARSNGYGGWNHRNPYYTTTMPTSIDANVNASLLDDDGYLPRPAVDGGAYGNGHHVYNWPSGNVDPEVQKRNQQSAKVVVFLFGSLMLVQVLGFCVVVALRRRAIQRAQNNDIFSVAIQRDAEGWNNESDEEDGIDNHPALQNLRAAMTSDAGLPSYDEALRDPDLPDYTVNATEPPPPINAPSLSAEEAAALKEIEAEDTSMDVEMDPLGATRSVPDLVDSDNELNDSISDNMPLISSSRHES